MNETLRAKNPGAKLRSIPVRLLFGDPDLNLRANYTLFDRPTGRPRCVGDGETCKRAVSNGVQVLPCPSPESCDLAEQGCKPFGRLNVRIGDQDELGSFVFRTTGFNSIRTLAARLKYFDAASGGLLATMPLELRLRGKSTAQSRRAAIYYVDLTARGGMTLSEAITAARAEASVQQATGFDQQRLDAAARLGFAQGAFEDSADEGAAILDEFFPAATESGLQQETTEDPHRGHLAARLRDRLENSRSSDSVAQDG